jgi:hypothetical protein
MVDCRHLPQLVNPEGDRMPHPFGVDHGRAGLAVERERHREQCL